jgi:hypothetical protein
MDVDITPHVASIGRTSFILSLAVQANPKFSPQTAYRV